jgi:hypothetical protein
VPRTEDASDDGYGGGTLAILKMKNTLSELLGRRNPYVVRATRKYANRKSMVCNNLQIRLFAQSSCSRSRTQVILNESPGTEVQVVH